METGLNKNNTVADILGNDRDGKEEKFSVHQVWYDLRLRSNKWWHLIWRIFQRTNKSVSQIIQDIADDICNKIKGLSLVKSSKVQGELVKWGFNPELHSIQMEDWFNFKVRMFFLKMSSGKGAKIWEGSSIGDYILFCKWWFFDEGAKIWKFFPDFWYDIYLGFIENLVSGEKLSMKLGFGSWFWIVLMGLLFQESFWLGLHFLGVNFRLDGNVWMDSGSLSFSVKLGGQFLWFDRMLLVFSGLLVSVWCPVRKGCLVSGVSMVNGGILEHCLEVGIFLVLAASCNLGDFFLFFPDELDPLVVLWFFGSPGLSVSWRLYSGRCGV
ncbi:hypothetical protein AgCh_005150 [Apium graveolens]